MARTPRKPQSQPVGRGTQPAPLTRRGRARWQRERQRQRQVVIAASTAIGLALLAVVLGVLYDRVWIPSRPVAQVNDVTLSRGAYWDERRHELARRITQNLQLIRTIGGQFGSQFASQIAQLDSQIPTIRNAPVDDQTVNEWIDRQVIVQGAAARGLQASDGEIAQQLVADLGTAFAPPPPPPTSTAGLTPTAALSSTSVLVAPSAPAATAAPTATAALTTTSVATATPGGPTATPAPTPTPRPTPLPEAALQQQEQILGNLYDAYVGELQNVDPQSRPRLTIDDFKAALSDQYLRQVLTEKIEAQLVPAESFTPSTRPSSITTRHILIKVTVPVTATESEREAAYAARRPEAEAILAQLRSGADFETLARERSEDTSTKDQGGLLPEFDAEGKTPEGTMFDPAFVAAALPLQEGQISDLVRTPFGWHIIKVVERRVESKEDQLRTARSKAFDEWMQQQRATAHIQRFPPITPTPTPLPTPEGTSVPLPTVPLGGEPTAVLTGTATLTGTTTVTGTPATSSTPLATSVPSPGAAATPPLPTAPVAAPTTETGTPQP